MGSNPDQFSDEISANEESLHPIPQGTKKPVPQVTLHKPPGIENFSAINMAVLKHTKHNNEIHFEEDDVSELNSYKFPKPRMYNPNHYVSRNEMDTAELLSNMAMLVGPKERPAQYIEFLTNTLKKSIKPKKAKTVVLNNFETDPFFLKGINLSIDKKSMSALMDTGSTHNLLAYDVFQTLQNRRLTPVNIDTKVAGATLSNNIVGKVQLNTVFPTTTGTVTIPVSYLIAHKLNGYQAILGAELLTNPRVIKATTPFHIHLKVPKRENFSIASFAQSEPIWICDVGTSKKIEFFSQLTPDFDGFWFFAVY